MTKVGSRGLPWGAILRMTADGLLVNLALMISLTIRFLLLVVMRRGAPINMDAALLEFTDAYLHNAAILTAVCLAVFYMAGFYTYGVWYNGKFKPLIIVKAVAIAFLAFGMMTYLTWDRLGLQDVPRGAFLISMVTCMGLCLTARACSFLWERVVRPEKEIHLKACRPIGKNVLVIGGAGYIGSALLPKLLAQGVKVRVLDRFLYGTDPIAELLGHPNLELVEGDFRHVEKVVQAMQGVDSVIHLGAIVGDPGCNLDEQVTIDVNLIATQTIARVAKACGVSKFIFASTCSVYGASDQILDEASTVEPISLYGRTKLIAEQGLMDMADHTFAPTVLRFATIYGFSGRTRFDLVINLLAAMAKIEGKITIHGGDQWRPFVHVDDAAQAVADILAAPLAKVGNQVFNVGSDEQNFTIQQVGELIHDYVFGAELIVNNETTDKRNYRVSFAKIRNVIGFRPRWSVGEGIEQVLEAVTSGAVKDFRDPRYSNVRFLSEKGVIQLLRVDDDWSQRLKKDSRAVPATEQIAGSLANRHVETVRAKAASAS